MLITKATQSYNERRYGKPWIAKVIITPAKPAGEFIWGTWIGDHRNGGEGELSLEVEVGDIVAMGQKDFRNPRKSTPRYSVVANDGNLIPCTGIVDARKEAAKIKEG